MRSMGKKSYHYTAMKVNKPQQHHLRQDQEQLTMRLGSEFVSVIIIMELASVLHPGHRVIFFVAHHANVDGVKVLDQVLEGHPKHAVVALHQALDLGLIYKCLSKRENLKKGKELEEQYVVGRFCALFNMSSQRTTEKTAEHLTMDHKDTKNKQSSQPAFLRSKEGNCPTSPRSTPCYPRGC